VKQENTMAKVIIGVDPHRVSATIEVVDTREELLGSGRFSTDQPGYTAMRAYAKTWPERVWAVEGSKGAGRPLAQRLLEAGEHVVDVPARLAARVRAPPDTDPPTRPSMNGVARIWPASLGPPPSARIQMR
jgi:hypothetical protein